MRNLKRSIAILVLLTVFVLGGCANDTNNIEIIQLQEKLEQTQKEAAHLAEANRELEQAIIEARNLKVADYLENPYQLAKQLAAEKCSDCHDLQLIDAHGSAHPHDWEVEIDRMIEFGANINEEQRDFLAHYYERIYPSH